MPILISASLRFYVQSERNLSISQGREMSRKQLMQFCGNDSDSEQEDVAKLEKISSSQDVAEPEPKFAPAPELKTEAVVEEQKPEPAAVEEQKPEPPAVEEQNLDPPAMEQSSGPAAVEKQSPEPPAVEEQSPEPPKEKEDAEKMAEP